jgi:hypothetical protein
VVFVLRKETRYVDEHGVVVKSTSHDLPEAFDDELGYLFWPRKNHAKSYHEVPFPPGMSVVDIGRMTVLSKKIWANTNLLAVRGRGGLRPYTLVDIGRVIGVEERQAYRFVDRMLKLGMMARSKLNIVDVKETHYYINPIYWFSGKRIPLNLYVLFRHQLDLILPKWVIERYGQAKSVEAKKH